ncbi:MULTISPECIES: PA domain-containing protein [unclassified Duganella]|uniref:PA domain-containing protein n=1 Tax=unclassified Duganella TaxID=2636909 RepID=UPI000E342AA1|nr:MULTISPECIES: PA domain-containing protein [unclassified Duganella]RFP13618.1 peptidase [Duganella sp. BJB475]RFP36326.1 peptidase [Duganella sp. BJB476]
MKRVLPTFIAAVALLVSSASWAAATITIVNGDPAGVGFNDPTPVLPVGGNSGTTLGVQRLNAFQAAANTWGATLTSTVPIRILATWEALPCDDGGAVLGSAGALEVFRDFAGAPRANAWFSKAEANKLFGADVDPAAPDIRARFNVNLGQPGCLTGTPFYLGLNDSHGAQIDLVTVLEHEFGHGLGFQTYTDSATGAQLDGRPSIWDHFLLDTSTGKLWKDMSNAERVASALKSGKLVWNGAIVNQAAQTVLQQGVPALTVLTPAGIAGIVQVGTASFGPPLANPGVTGEVMPVVDTAPDRGLACDSLSPANALAVGGKIAVIDRGSCTFVIKVKNAQDAGAIGVIIVDNVAGAPPPGLGGTDPSIVIPAVRVTLDDGARLKAALATRSRKHSGVFANLGVNLALRAGADAAGRVLMYAPNPNQPGSSVSHYDTSAFPNLLMEPAINGDLTHDVAPPRDLTFPLLRDLGW